MRTHRQHRRGFTLLELLLAMSIGALLLAALYLSLDLTLQRTQANRDAIAFDEVSRAVFNRVQTDLANVLGPPPPMSGGTASDASLAATVSDVEDPAELIETEEGTEGGEGGEVVPETEVPAATTPTTPTTGTTEGEDPAVVALPAYQVGILGSSTRLTIFASRVPEILAVPGALVEGADPNMQSPSDLVRIDYWVAEGQGLCRRVRPWVTDDITATVFAANTESLPGDVIAHEVTGVEFKYFDGTDFYDTWTTSGSIPGPPLAVRVTLLFEQPDPRGGGGVISRVLTQVIPIRTAPGTTPVTVVDPVAPPAVPTEPDDTGDGTGEMGQ